MTQAIAETTDAPQIVPASLDAKDIGKELTASLELGDINAEELSIILVELGYDDGKHLHCLETAMDEEGNEEWVGKQVRNLIREKRIDGLLFLTKLREFDVQPG